MGNDFIYPNKTSFAAYPLEMTLSEATAYEQLDMTNTSEWSPRYNTETCPPRNHTTTPMTPPSDHDTPTSSLDKASAVHIHGSHSGSEHGHASLNCPLALPGEPAIPLSPAAIIYMETAEDLYVIVDHLRSLAEDEGWEEIDRWATRFEAIGDLWGAFPEVSPYCMIAW